MRTNSVGVLWQAVQIGSIDQPNPVNHPSRIQAIMNNKRWRSISMRLAVALAAGVMVTTEFSEACVAAETDAGQPNILFIITDQQYIEAMSAAGNPHLKTPAMDSLAARGMRFTKSYCTYPVCTPSRA